MVFPSFTDGAPKLGAVVPGHTLVRGKAANHPAAQDRDRDLGFEPKQAGPRLQALPWLPFLHGGQSANCVSLPHPRPTAQ